MRKLMNIETQYSNPTLKLKIQIKQCINPSLENEYIRFNRRKCIQNTSMQLKYAK